MEKTRGKSDVDLNQPPDVELTKFLLQNAISIQRPWLGKFFVEQPGPASWQENPSLRYCRYILFEDGAYQELPNHYLTLSRMFGLEIIKKESLNA